MREDAEQEVDNKGKVEQEEAILEPDTEEAATQLPRKPATLGIYNSDDLTVVEAEGRLEESWAGIDAEIR